MDTPRFKRVLLKISGESLMGNSPYGIDIHAVNEIAQRVSEVHQAGVDVAAVVGGGNILRGRQAEELGMDRATADQAGMLATIINALTLQDALEKVGIATRTQSAVIVQAVAEPYIRRRAIRHLEKGRVVLFAGGTGNPFITTDTAAALRTVEIGAEVLLMAKNRVDGVYDADPRIEPGARRYDSVDYLDVLNQRLDVMDSTALSLCMDHKIPIIVFDLFIPDNVKRLLAGERVGTLIGEFAPVPAQGGAS